MALFKKAKVDTCRAVQYHWVVWKFLGLEPPKRESKWFKAYILYAIILNTTVIMFTASLIVNLILSKNLSELCENIGNTTTDLTCNIKFFYIPFIRHKLLKVHKILERLDARATKRKEVAILEEGIASARKLFIIFALLCFFFVMSAQVAVFFSSERIQIYPTWIPWDWQASRRNYLLTQLYIFYVTSLQSTQIVLSDTYPPAYLIILSAQVKALALRIKTLGTTGTSTDEQLYKELADCIKDHNTIHELFNNIQDSISTACLIQFAATGVSQCTLGVYLFYVGIQPTKLLNIFLYFAAITMEIFILCYYGDLYCQANDHLIESIYECNWVDRNKKFKKSLMLLLQRSQIYSAITAGVLIPVRMPTFVKVIKTAYSVFTVLNNANTN